MLAELARYRNATSPRRVHADRATDHAIMKFHLNAAEGNVFTGHGPGFVRLGVVEYRDNILVTAEQIVTGWAPAGFDALTPEDFAAIAALAPEVALLGTGSLLRFPHPRLTRALLDARIGLEIMDTAAACRTFNILAAEGRRVAAAVLVGN
jgi:uncharacterized protein